MNRRQLLAATMIALGAPPAAAQSASAFREITWDELVPRDWDPMKQFKELNFGAMNDADPRAQQMLKRMREAWDNAPTNGAMDEQRVRLPGYVVPLEESKSGLREFLLVPYFGACIHTPPPPSNQIVHVLPATAQKLRSMDVVWVSGTLRTLRTDSFMGASSYRMEGVAVEPWVPPAAEAPKAAAPKK